MKPTFGEQRQGTFSWWTAIAVTIVIAASPVQAWGADQNWLATFQQETVDSHLEAGPLAYILVGAGEASSKEAVNALRRAVSDSARVKMAMDAAALGNVKALADEDIVKKAAALPVDRVMIVRVFEGAATTAVVTIYDKSGESRGAFTGVAGQAMTKSEKKTSGVTSAAANAVGAIIGDTAEMSDEQKEKYLEQALWLKGMTGVYGSQYGIWTSSWQEPRLGKYGKPISWEEFFERVGRDDLALQIQEVDDYSGMRILGSFLGIPGYISLVVGAGMAVPAFLADVSPEFRKWTWICLGSGAGLAIVGHLIHALGPDLPDVPAHEIREMVDKHNTRLKKDLGIGKAGVENSSFRILAAPVVSPDYYGLSIAIRF
jgi:hypothetical protein